MTNGEFLKMLADRLRAFGGPEATLEEVDRLNQIAEQMLKDEAQAVVRRAKESLK